MDIQTQSKKEYGLQSIEFEASDCITKPLTIIGTFTTTINLEKVSSSLHMVGKVQLNTKLNLIRVNSKRFSIIIYGDGTFKINFKKQENLTIQIIRETIQSFIFTILRSLECINCGLCVGKCNQKAISIIDNRLIVNSKKCTKCNQCFSACPIVTIVHRDVNDEIKTAIKRNKNEIMSSSLIE